MYLASTELIESQCIIFIPPSSVLTSYIVASENTPKEDCAEISIMYSVNVVRPLKAVDVDFKLDSVLITVLSAFFLMTAL